MDESFHGGDPPPSPEPLEAPEPSSEEIPNGFYDPIDETVKLRRNFLEHEIQREKIDREKKKIDKEHLYIQKQHDISLKKTLFAARAVALFTLVIMITDAVLTYISHYHQESAALAAEATEKAAKAAERSAAATEFSAEATEKSAEATLKAAEIAKSAALAQQDAVDAAIATAYIARESLELERRQADEAAKFERGLLTSLANLKTSLEGQATAITSVARAIRADLSARERRWAGRRSDLD